MHGGHHLSLVCACPPVLLAGSADAVASRAHVHGVGPAQPSQHDCTTTISIAPHPAAPASQPCPAHQYSSGCSSSSSSSSTLAAGHDARLPRHWHAACSPGTAMWPLTHGATRTSSPHRHAAPQARASFSTATAASPRSTSSAGLVHPAPSTLHQAPQQPHSHAKDSAHPAAGPAAVYWARRAQGVYRPDPRQELTIRMLQVRMLHHNNQSKMYQ